jgi:hypothetical protein
MQAALIDAGLMKCRAKLLASGGLYKRLYER